MSKKMKLLYIGNALSGHGYSPTSADIMPELFQKAGFEVKVVSSKKSVIFRFFEMLSGVFWSARSTDYVLIDTYSTKNFWYAYLCSRLSRVMMLRYIPILRGGDLPQRMDRSPGMAKVVFGHAYRNVAPSGYLLDALKERGFMGELIPNTLNVEDYKFRLRETIRPKLLYVRAFARLYNPQMALYVLKDLIATNRDAQLCMVGADKDGTMEECKLLARKLGVEHHVKFAGKLSKKDWHAVSEDYDIFINTTNKDNTPVSVMEAMALGLPVVSTNPGGMPFLIEHEHDGLLVDVNDVDAMVAKIRLLLSDPSQAISLAKAARSKVEGFDWDQVKLQWRDLLESCD
jgi:glycosyltransferase involved in cell wall biosynthesis